MECKKTFKRHEKKYLITSEQKKQMMKLLGKKVEKDAHFKSTVMSLYLDTENDDLIVKSIEKPAFKEKVRVRSYGVPEMDTNVFFEIKTKRKTKKEKNGYKRRFVLTYEDYLGFLKGEKLGSIAERRKCGVADRQMAAEIDYLVEKLGLRPKIMILNNRESYFWREDENFRLTFDAKLRYRTKDFDFRGKSRCTKYFDNDKIILEVKSVLGMPLDFVKVLNQCQIYPQSFSKYGAIYKKMKGEKNV